MSSRSQNADEIETAFMNKVEFAKRWSVSRRTVELWINAKLIPCVRPSLRTTRIPVAEADKRLLEKFKINAAN